MSDYDISKAFEKIEDELIASMMRNMKRHKSEEVKEDKQWSMWQAEQLKSLEKYKVQNRKTFSGTFGNMNRSMVEMILASKQEGGMKQEVRIMQAIKKGFKVSGKNAGGSPVANASFFQLNDKKLDTLIKATTSDMKKAETAILRRANDQYRKVIYSAQVYANTGAGTYAKAVDMATKDMLLAGLNCVEYANGARHTAADYADMAIKTANKRAYLMGEGEKRKEWGIHTVIINKRGNPCPKCLPFVGKVFIDDVWSGGSAADGDYPLLSQAISMGLYHPRCKDSHNTYFPGISPEPEEKFTKQEMDDIEQDYKEEQKRNYAAKQAEKFDRLSKYSLDDENKKIYGTRKKEWAKRLDMDGKSSTIELQEWSQESIEQRYKDEKIISVEKKERAILYNGDGKKLFYKRGAEHSVSFTKDEIRKMKDGVLTHNHPLGATFSESDINMLNKANLSEIRAVGRDGIYVLKRPRKWPEEIGTHEKLEKAYAAIDLSLKDKMESLFMSINMSVKDYNIIYQDKIIQELSQKYGLDYRMEAWDK